MSTSFRCGPARAFAVGIRHLLIFNDFPALATAFHPFLLILRQTDVIQRLTDEKADSAKKTFQVCNFERAQFEGSGVSEALRTDSKLRETWQLRL
jgi:hypothetical protein